MYTTCSELVVFMYWTGKSMNNLLSYCGLVDARISASEKDLPVKGNTVARTDYRFYSSKLWFFFPEALTRKSKTIAYMEHVCFRI